MMRLYTNIFYRIYSWNLKRWGKKDNPKWNALFGVSFIMFLNIYDIREIFDFCRGHLNEVELPKEGLIFLGTIIIIVNYFWFVYKNKYLKIVKQYSNENIRERIRNVLLLWLFVIFSFSLPIILINIRKTF